MRGGKSIHPRHMRRADGVGSRCGELKTFERIWFLLEDFAFLGLLDLVGNTPRSSKPSRFLSREKKSLSVFTLFFPNEAASAPLTAAVLVPKCCFSTAELQLD